MSWAAGRITKREEDAAYSLLGLFDLHMPLIYGEGRTKALIRLQREIESASTYGRSSNEGLGSKIVHADIRIHSIEEDSPSPIATVPIPPKRAASDAFETTQSDMGRISQQRRRVKAKAGPPDDNMALEHAETMQMWWEGAIAKNMTVPEDYQTVAVLLVKWVDELDELQTRKEVRALGF